MPEFVFWVFEMLVDPRRRVLPTVTKLSFTVRITPWQHAAPRVLSSDIPESFFLTRQLRRSQTSVTAGFIGIHFFRVVQQPPRGAAKSTFRPALVL